MAIDAGYTITALSGQDGSDGQNGASLSVQYSVDGTSNWHDTFASGDIYMRQKLGSGSWSSAIKIVGEDGQDGTDGDDGIDGTNTWYSSVSARTSTTSIALSTITAVAGHSVAVGDLIIANSLVFLVSAVGSTNATVSYKQSIKGDNSVTYEIDCPMVFKKGNTVTFTFYKVESGVRTSATVYARWYYSIDGTNWTEGAGSKVTGTSLTTTALNSSIKVRCEIYASSSATTALDIEYSSLVTDGTNGTNGTRGSVWYTGNKITGTSTTATVFSGSGITDAKVGDMYKNTDTSYTYQCTVAGNASTAKWVYTGSIKGSAGTNGTNGTNGTSATNVYLGNENITLACDKDGKLKSALSTTVKVGAYTGTARVASTITKNSNSSNVTVGTIVNGTTSADGSVPLTMSASTAVTAGELVLKVVANSITFYKTVTISVAKDGTNGTNGVDSYSCETSASSVTVATGTDRKPVSAGSVNIVFKAFKGTTALTAVASSATSVSATQFRVTTPTASQGGLTITQSTNGTLNIAWTTGTAIDATRSIAVTVAIGSTSNTVTKTITISASIKGPAGGTGSRAIRYLGKSATKPNSSSQTSGVPTGLATPIVGDWYLCTTDGYVYACTAVSNGIYTWSKIQSETDFRLLACVQDLIVLHKDLDTNATLNAAVEAYTSALAVGTLLANAIFSNQITLSGDFIIYDKNNNESFRIENDGGIVIADNIHSNDFIAGHVKKNDASANGYIISHRNTNSKDINGTNGVYNSYWGHGIWNDGFTIQGVSDTGANAQAKRNNSALRLQSYGGSLIIGDDTSVVPLDESDRVRSFLPIIIPAFTSSIYNETAYCNGSAKALGVIACSLDLNDKSYRGHWSDNESYAVGDVVYFTPDNSGPDFYRCIAAHTSSFNLYPTDTTKWESATSSGYVVLSNGLKIQWGEVTTGNDVTKTFDFSSLGLLVFTSSNYKAVFTQKKVTQNRYDANVFIVSQTSTGMTIRGQNDSCSFIVIGY